MEKNFRVISAIAFLALAVLACSALSRTPSNTVDEPLNNNDSTVSTSEVPTIEFLPTQEDAPSSHPDILFDDDFSESRIKWGTGTDIDSSVEYVGESLNFQVFTQNYFVWTSPNDKEYENIHMEVTVINNGTDSNTAFGFICNKQYPISESNYYFAVTPSGQYAIAKAALAQNDLFLTNNDEWGDSDLIAKAADSYRLGADCGNNTLTLFVDGQEIASVEDSSYTSGGVALFVWSGKDAAVTDVSFDDFYMTQLP